jgi:hypothetical protein
MKRPPPSLAILAFIALAIGLATPALDVVWKCRAGFETSEACVWGKSLFPLMGAISVVIIAPVTFGVLLFIRWVWRMRAGRSRASVRGALTLASAPPFENAEMSEADAKSGNFSLRWFCAVVAAIAAPTILRVLGSAFLWPLATRLPGRTGIVLAVTLGLVVAVMSLWGLAIAVRGAGRFAREGQAPWRATVLTGASGGAVGVMVALVAQPADDGLFTLPVRTVAGVLLVSAGLLALLVRASWPRRESSSRTRAS